MPSISYLSPLGESAVHDTNYGRRPSLTSDDRVGLLINSFPGSDDFLRSFAEGLHDRFGEITQHEYAKGGIRDSTETLGPERVAHIASECDVVFGAYGHCGSCTSAIVRDGVALAGLGARVCLFVTEEFRDTAGFIARAVGMSNIPIVWLPHPMSSRTPEERRAIALERLDEAMSAIEGLDDGARI
ncbi:MAG: hypothetical protein KF680_04255 [Cryobacterium sp.]|nr:hypothetical protein [Cryobacterium sp.]